MLRITASLVSILLAASAPLHGDAGGVRGRVTFHGEGVGGVYVQAFEYARVEDVEAGAANTASDGTFHIALPSGSYRLTARKRPEGPGSAGMLFASTGKGPVEVGAGILDVPPLQLADSGGAGNAGTGSTTVTGTVTAGGKPLAGAHVFFYPGTDRRGPGYVARARSGDGGRFRTSLAPGLYTVTARFGWSGDGMGTVGVEDLVGRYPSNPVAVETKDLDLGAVDVRAVDPEAWQSNRWAGAQASITVEGAVRDENRLPVAGAYVFLYADRRMVGKPCAISPPTGSDGRYVIPVEKPGTYYLGARTRFGGPVEPGEFMGAWGGDNAEPLVLEGDGPSAMLDITVREVW